MVHQYTVGWKVTHGDGYWAVYEDGHVYSEHGWRWSAVAAAKAAAINAARRAKQEATTPVCKSCRRPL